MSSDALAGNSSHYPDKEVAAVHLAADLLAAGSEGRGDEVVRILDVDLELILVGDLTGDTVLHLLVSGGYLEPLVQLVMFMLEKNPNLLKHVAKQGNVHGDTPLHLAVMNGHKQIANLLGKLEGKSILMENDFGETPFNMASGTWGPGYFNWILNMWASSGEKEMPHNGNKDGIGGVYEHLLNVLDGSYRFPQYLTTLSDINIEIEFRANIDSFIYEGKILEMLEVDPNLISYKNWRGDTVLHEMAFSENMDMLRKLVEHLVTISRKTICEDRFQLPTLRLLLEGNNNGCTPLHHAINRGKMKASRYLMEVAPEAAYRVNNDGESPLYVAIKNGHYQLVKQVFEAMPEASMPPVIRSSLLTPNKSSLPHAAIRFRKFSMLKMILESIPRLIDSLDDKGWKPLSYAAFKGYDKDVQYLLNKFPESVNKFDSDGSLPIHKAVSGGHVCIVKAFISIHPNTLYCIDKKGRNILHIAVKRRKRGILGYLKDEVKAVEKLYDLRDNDGKTFADYAPKNN